MNKKEQEPLLFRLSLTDAAGNQVQMNLPVTLIRLLEETGGNALLFSLVPPENLDGLDIAEILRAADNGRTGEIFTRKRADGVRMTGVLEVMP